MRSRNDLFRCHVLHSFFIVRNILSQISCFINLVGARNWAHSARYQFRVPHFSLTASPSIVCIQLTRNYFDYFRCQNYYKNVLPYKTLSILQA
jgi:hypothetical protein